MQYVADLHLHSKYSRAVSRDMVLPTMAAWARKKGIDLLTTGDWTHPLWFREIRGLLEETADGVYRLKSETREPLFILTVEVSSIYSQGGKLRRIHNLIFAPNFDTAEKINKELQRRGVNLLSDGRPMMGLSSINLIELVLTIDKNALLIPCHAWTPWFSLYGSNSGFDSIEECFGDYAKYIYGVETGLSSDPEMNWRIAELENRSILSFSDAHSPAKMGREATVFELPEISYENIRKAIMETYLTVEDRGLKVGVEGRRSKIEEKRIYPQSSNFKNQSSIINHLPSSRILYTIEFYPEEGKYHYTGHRNCKIVQTPQETKANGSTCPVCQRKLTVGVMHRVEELSQKTQNTPQFRESDISDNHKVRYTGSSELSESSENQKETIDKQGVKWIKDPSGRHPPFIKLVPLLEIIAEALDSTTASGKVREAFDNLVEQFGSEIEVLLKVNSEEIARQAGPKVAEGIKKVRSGNIVIAPGFDGEYGKVKIWGGESVDGEVEKEAGDKSEQMGLF